MSQPVVISELDGEQTAVQIRTVASRGGVVVLCCHNQDRIDLELVANRLQSRGCLVEIVGTIDMDSGALSSAIDHHGNNARFVFCKTERFRTRHIDKYKQFLLSLQVEEGSILILDFNGDNPDNLIESIIRALIDFSSSDDRRQANGLLASLKKSIKNFAPNQVLFVGGIVALMLVSGLALLYLSGADQGTPASTSKPLPRHQATADSRHAAEPVQNSPELERIAVLEEQRIIDSLIRQKKIRSLDNILILIADAEPMGIVDARDHCRQMKLSSVKHWRLPSLGEARSIAIAGLAPKGTLWSDTPADIQGENSFTWNTEEQSSLAHDDTWKNGQVICVRPRFFEDGTANTALQKR